MVTQTLFIFASLALIYSALRLEQLPLSSSSNEEQSIVSMNLITLNLTEKKTKNLLLSSDKELVVQMGQVRKKEQENEILKKVLRSECVQFLPFW